MRSAQVILTDERGGPLWRGSLREFFRANAYALDDARAVVEQLRPRPDGRRGGPVPLGGGAAPLFGLSLAERTGDRR